MLSAMQAPSTRRHMNAATTPKLRNTMAAVSCGESDEKNDTDVFKSQSRSCFTVGQQRSATGSFSSGAYEHLFLG